MIPAFFWGVADYATHAASARSLEYVAFALAALMEALAPSAPSPVTRFLLPRAFYPTRLPPPPVAVSATTAAASSPPSSPFLTELPSPLLRQKTRQPSVAASPLAASVVACVYVLGFVGTFLGPTETKRSARLPED